MPGCATRAVGMAREAAHVEPRRSRSRRAAPRAVLVAPVELVVDHARAQRAEAAVAAAPGRLAPAPRARPAAWSTGRSGPARVEAVDVASPASARGRPGSRTPPPGRCPHTSTCQTSPVLVVARVERHLEHRVGLARRRTGRASGRVACREKTEKLTPLAARRRARRAAGWPRRTANSPRTIRSSRSGPGLSRGIGANPTSGGRRCLQSGEAAKVTAIGVASLGLTRTVPSPGSTHQCPAASSAASPYRESPREGS